MWETLQQEKLEESNIQTALCYVGANAHISANTSTWNFMYLFRNGAEAQCQPQLVIAVHLFPSGLKLLLHKTQQNPVASVYGIKQLQQPLALSSNRFKTWTFKNPLEVFIFLNCGPGSLRNAHPFFNLAKSLVSSTSQVPLFNHKAACKNILLFLVWISHLLHLLVLIPGNRRKFLFIFPALLGVFRPFWFSDHIFSSGCPLICIYLKYISFLLLLVRIFFFFFQVLGHYYWFSLDCLDFAVTF